MTPKVFIRSYAKLKTEVTSGRYRPGQRLQARTLADVLKASTSPITNAMRQMVGEQILEYTADDGFIIPWVTEQRLRDLLGWTAWLTSATFDDQDTIPITPSPLHTGDGSDDTLQMTEQLFVALAGASPNGDHIWAISNSNDRLRSIRILESSLFADRSDEIAAMVETWRQGNRPALRRALSRYHRRRIEGISQLIALSYQERR